MGVPPDMVFGAFDGTTLIGVAGFLVEKGIKVRHKGPMWGVYVSAAWRGRAVGGSLVSRVLDQARRRGEILRTGVVVNGQGGVRLHHRLGFKTYAIERRALKIGRAYFDEELIEISF